MNNIKFENYIDAYLKITKIVKPIGITKTVAC